MSEQATVFEPTDDHALDEAVRRARAEVAAGDFVPLADVARWLESWGISDELPPPPWK